VSSDRVRIKDGCAGAGQTGRALGPQIFEGQWWTPVLWDKGGDPDWHKTSGLEESPAPGLKPCPFCGGNDVVLVPVLDAQGEEVPDAYGVSCPGCQFDFAIGDSTAEEIAAAWNRRSQGDDRKEGR
jgi:Lar family restriction alleviation protein